jgi:hypothetical protein
MTSRYAPPLPTLVHCTDSYRIFQNGAGGVYKKPKTKKRLQKEF